MNTILSINPITVSTTAATHSMVQPETYELYAQQSEVLKGANRPRVVIVGAGFGGLHAARALAGTDVDVVVIDRNNYHGFWPLLYQVATAGLEPEAIAYPVRAIFRKYRNINFQMGEVRHVDLEKRTVHIDGRSLTYDYLITAAGSTNNYFGNDKLAEHTLGLKDIGEAETLRNRLLCAFEQAAAEPDPERRQMMSFVIVGGGPTGVELAGAISELIRPVLAKDYPLLDVSQARVTLVEATDHLLASFPESLQKSALRKLKSMGVAVELSKPVASVDDSRVVFKDGTVLHASLVIWAAGVQASKLAKDLKTEQDRNARVKVKPALNLPEHPEVFVIGDMAYLEGYKHGQAYPMLAPVAIQQGKRAAGNIILRIQGRPMRPFRYLDRGTMATIGRRFAVLDAFGIHMSGRVAWFGWLFIHITNLIGFRNRLIVLINWAFNYFTYERGVRLITG